MKSERIVQLEKNALARGAQQIPSHFQVDLHRAAQTEFAHLPQWEKIARSMAYAMENQDVRVYPEDRIGGHITHNELRVENPCPDLDYMSAPRKRFLEENPGADELQRLHLITGVSRGHVTWHFDRILADGIEGLQARTREALAHAKDEEAEQFYRGVLILLDSVLAFNDKHVAAYEAMGNHELAERMKKVPRHGAETFREAVQAFLIQHICVMAENPFGGNGPGRLDVHLWPYLERDLAAGRCTLEEAKEIIDELFLNFEERLYNRDMWVEAIVVGGTHPDGSSAVNPLTYIMVQSVMDLNIIHPGVYVRLPENPPEELIHLCARYMISGGNRAQILYDPAVMGAMMNRGIPFADASQYACGGCMEVSAQGMNSDYLFMGWQNTSKMLELMITGGVCLRSGKKITGFLADKGLAAYENFEDFYRDFIEEARRLTDIQLHMYDSYSEAAQIARPSYLLSSMIDDCIERGRNMHAGGARYHDYGGTHLAMPNTADGLYAVKEAVFEKKLCTADELIEAMKADYCGYETLQAKLRALPKYGVDHPGADALARRMFSDFADMYLNYHTRWDGRGVPVILTFVYATAAAADLGATPDGRNAGKVVAQGVTPHSASMTEGVTAAINSCTKMPFGKFAGGASSMWDFDSDWAKEPVIEALLKTFIENGGQIFQGNTTPVEEMIRAQENPDEYRNLFVRVGGYSSRFVNLSKELQDEIIKRRRHGG